MVQGVEANLRHIYDDLQKQKFHVVIFEKMKFTSTAFVSRPLLQFRSRLLIRVRIISKRRQEAGLSLAAGEKISVKI